ncbi:MAG TPA: AAA family ATPase [Candidatus Omnitrophota bacterium]|nr:AAA family ATPase [Candidatus Omnitrophota bacterium]
MRIAISGAHRTGKSTLVEGLCRSLPGHTSVQEPYRALEEEGHPFHESPTLEDFELQLERSIRSLLSGAANQVFDRCPADFLAYLATHRNGSAFDPEPWMERARSAMQTLDLVVLVPIEQPDRIQLSAGDRPKWRRRVADELRALLLDDALDLGVTCIEVRGDAGERLDQVLRHLRGSQHTSERRG